MTANNTQEISYHPFLQGGGEMGELIRQYDWSENILGNPENWSASLLTTLSIMLNSRFPMFLWWGPELIQFYNDAYRPSLGRDGKHPKALGQRGVDCWQEIWPVIKPLIDQVMAGGESTWSEDQLIPIYRNNRLEDVYWTFSYSRVNDQSGKPAGVLVICNETTEKIKTYQAVKEAKNELEFAIGAAELGTWDLNPKTNKFLGNDRLKAWFGLQPEEEIDLQKALDIIADEDREKVVHAIEKAMEKGSDGNYDIVYTISNPRDNLKRIVKAKGKAVFDSEENAYRFTGILQDVTEEYQVQQRKDEFISVASHELRTPLTTLKASMQMLEKIIQAESVPEKLPLFFSKAHNSLNKLMVLMDDLMNVSKIQQGQLALDKTWFDLPELVRDCLDHAQLRDTHELVLSGTDKLMILADLKRIEQVLVNLINNAIKYSPRSNKIEVEISQADTFVRVSVRDFGIGISAEKLPHLFDRYYRADPSGIQFSGLGLGLYISADIVERHDGRIGVNSTLGEGSEFWFTLPFGRA